MSCIGSKGSFISFCFNCVISVSVDVVDIDNCVFVVSKRFINDLCGFSFCFLCVIGWVNDLSVIIVLSVVLLVVVSIILCGVIRFIFRFIFIIIFWRGDNV